MNEKEENSSNEEFTPIKKDEFKRIYNHDINGYNSNHSNYAKEKVMDLKIKKKMFNNQFQSVRVNLVFGNKDNNSQISLDKTEEYNFKPPNKNPKNLMYKKINCFENKLKQNENGFNIIYSNKGLVFDENNNYFKEEFHSYECNDSIYINENNNSDKKDYDKGEEIYDNGLNDLEELKKNIKYMENNKLLRKQNKLFIELLDSNQEDSQNNKKDRNIIISDLNINLNILTQYQVSKEKNEKLENKKIEKNKKKKNSVNINQYKINNIKKPIYKPINKLTKKSKKYSFNGDKKEKKKENNCSFKNKILTFNNSYFTINNSILKLKEKIMKYNLQNNSRFFNFLNYSNNKINIKKIKNKYLIKNNSYNNKNAIKKNSINIAQSLNINNLSRINNSYNCEYKSIKKFINYYNSKKNQKKIINKDTTFNKNSKINMIFKNKILNAGKKDLNNNFFEKYNRMTLKNNYSKIFSIKKNIIKNGNNMSNNNNYTILNKCLKDILNNKIMTKNKSFNILNKKLKK